jgi:ribosomal protein S18 acetylase RimI-like enzyme
MARSLRIARIPTRCPVSIRHAAVSVRRATFDDLPTVVALRLALLREHGRNVVYKRLRADAELRAQRLFGNQLESADEATFLAERDGEVVGILRCVHSTGSPLLFPAHYGYVSSVYVPPAHRRSGILRALLDEAVAWCDERGLTEIRLHNAADNPLAEQVWERLGFELVEQLRVRLLRRP